MASCYGKQGMASVSPAQQERENAVRRYLPMRTKLKDDTPVDIDYFRDSEHEAGWRLLNNEIEEGRSWPFEETLSLDEFRAYFLSHHAFVVRSKPSAAGRSGEVLGIFYVKPNFPGRCSHVCNGGFITREESRNNGVGTVMALAFLRLARDLGYQASYFNLVFAVNSVSVSLWEGLGFTLLATVPRAARLAGEKDLTDAHMFYYDLTRYEGEGPPSSGVKGMVKVGGERKRVLTRLVATSLAAAVVAGVCLLYLRSKGKGTPLGHHHTSLHDIREHRMTERWKNN